MIDRPADIIDAASDLAEQMLQEQLAAFKAKQSTLPAVSVKECVDCGEPIPEQRRAAVKGCQRCIECQQFADKATRR